MQAKIRTLFQNEFLQAGFLLTIANIGVSLMNYFFNIIVARSLGPTYFGEMTTLFSYLAVISVPTTIFSYTLIHRVAQEGDNRLAYAKAVDVWLFSKIKKWWFLIIFFLPLVFFIQPLTNLTLVSAIALFVLLLVGIADSFYFSLFQGTRLFLYMTVLSLGAIFIKLSGALLLLTRIGTYPFLLICIVLSILLKAGTSKYVLQRLPSAGKAKHIQKKLTKVLTNKMLWLSTCSLLGITIVGNADVMIVKKFFSGHEAGLYSSWSLLSKMILYAAGSFLSVSYIFFSSSDKKDQHKKMFLITLSLLSICLIAGIVGYSLFGQVLITIFFGAKFQPILHYIPLAGIFGGLYMMLFYINQYILSQKNWQAAIIILTTPIYLALLLFNTSSIQSIMYINIAYTFALLVVYLGVLVFIYKRPVHHE